MTNKKVISSGAIMEMMTSFVITENTIPINKIVGTSLNILHHRDERLNALFLIFLVIFPQAC